MEQDGIRFQFGVIKKRHFLLWTGNSHNNNFINHTIHRHSRSNMPLVIYCYVWRLMVLTKMRYFAGTPQKEDMMTGTVYKSTGSWYTVKNGEGDFYECRIKGKFRIQGIKSTNPIAVGDLVRFRIGTYR